MITFIEDAFADGHEIVVKEALSSLCSLTRLKVAYKYIKSHLIETQRTCGHVSPLLCHPSAEIRNSVVSYFAIIISILSEVELQVFVMPILRGFLCNKRMNVTLRGILSEKNDERQTRIVLQSMLISPLEEARYYELTSNVHPPEFENEKDFTQVGKSLVEYNSSVQEVVAKHLRAVWGHQHSYRRSYKQLVAKGPDDDKALKRRDRDGDLSSNISSRRQYSFNGPLPVDDSVVNIKNVPQRTIAIPDQRFLKPSDIPYVFSSRNRKGRKQNQDATIQTKIRNEYGVEVNHKHTGNRLKKQFQSLRIPNLPPNLGFLRDDNMEEFTSYFTDVDGNVYKYKSVFNDRGITLNPKDNSSARSNIKPFGTTQTASPTRQRCERFKTLLAELNGQHTGSITSIVVPDDQSLFLSGSVDGTIRAWRFQNLFTDVHYRSSAVTKTLDETAVTSMAAYDNSKTFMYGTAGGKVQVLCIESAPFSQVRSYDT